MAIVYFINEIVALETIQRRKLFKGDNYSIVTVETIIHGKTVGVSQKADLLYHSLNQNLTKLCSQIQMQQFSSKFNTNNLQQNSTQQYCHLVFSCKLYFLENIDMYIETP